jgi:two-component system phosphate regulon response regulator PhoB
VSEGRDRVLIVDDEDAFLDLLSFNLAEAGMAPECAKTGADGIAAALRLRPVVVILDLMLPDVSGTEVCRRLRSDPQVSDVGVLMITARGDEYDRIVGFEVGADDYVVKPFSVREVVLRVKALARRVLERRSAQREIGEGRRLRHEGLEVDPLRHKVFIEGEEVSLRPLEFKLLVLLLENPGRVYSRAELLQEVWGMPGDLSTRTVDTHIRRLRSRLGPYEDAIETVPGFGYRFVTSIQRAP